MTLKYSVAASRTGNVLYGREQTARWRAWRRRAAGFLGSFSVPDALDPGDVDARDLRSTTYA